MVKKDVRETIQQNSSTNSDVEADVFPGKRRANMMNEGRA